MCRDLKASQFHALTLQFYSMQGKVVFVAPTRPLVAQQIAACQRFMGLDPSAMAEMTGRIKNEDRKGVWHSDVVRAYFCTPQTFWNDVNRGICPYDAITCVVLDECHRVTGQADAAKALRFMREKHRLKFRTLGLSATPGSSADQVQEVLTTLGTAAIVFQSESDPDVAPYVHKKVTDLEIVDAESEESGLRAPLLVCLQKLVGHLVTARLYFGAANAEQATRFALLQAQQAAQRAASSGTAGKPSTAATEWFRQAMVLCDLRDQLDNYGVHAALGYLRDKLTNDYSIRSLHGKNPVFGHFVSTLERAAAAGGSSTRVRKLVEILQAHFNGAAGSEDGPSRVIVFTNLRDGVNAIIDALSAHAPLITAKAFIGQGGAASGPGARSSGPGMKQKEQKEVLQGFSSGAFNTLVATCIGEEGLDIPAVDLIVCFDATASPTRAVQRQGRTGRHREGRVVYILSAGREEERFRHIEDTTRRLHAQLNDPERHFTLHASSPRMLPRMFDPEMLELPVASPDALREGAAGSTSTGAGRGRGRGRSNSAGRGHGRGRGRGRGRSITATAEPDAATKPDTADAAAIEGVVRRPDAKASSSASAVPKIGALQRGMLRAAELAAAAAAAAWPLLFPSSSSFIIQIPGQPCPAITPPPASLVAACGVAKANTDPEQGAPQVDTPDPPQRQRPLLPEISQDGTTLALPSGRKLVWDDDSLHPWAFLAAADARPAPPAVAVGAAAPRQGGKKRRNTAAPAGGKKFKAPAPRRDAQGLDSSSLAPRKDTAVLQPESLPDSAHVAAPLQAPEEQPGAPLLREAEDPILEQRHLGAPKEAVAEPEVIDLVADDSQDLDDGGGEVQDAADGEDYGVHLSQQPLVQRRQQLVKRCTPAPVSVPAQHGPPAVPAVGGDEDVPLSTRLRMLHGGQKGLAEAVLPRQQVGHHTPAEPTAGTTQSSIPTRDIDITGDSQIPPTAPKPPSGLSGQPSWAAGGSGAHLPGASDALEDPYEPMDGFGGVDDDFYHAGSYGDGAFDQGHGDYSNADANNDDDGDEGMWRDWLPNDGANEPHEDQVQDPERGNADEADGLEDHLATQDSLPLARHGVGRGAPRRVILDSQSPGTTPQGAPPLSGKLSHCFPAVVGLYPVDMIALILSGCSSGRSLATFVPRCRCRAGQRAGPWLRQRPSPRRARPSAQSRRAAVYVHSRRIATGQASMPCTCPCWSLRRLRSRSRAPPTSGTATGCLKVHRSGG